MSLYTMHNREKFKPLNRREPSHDWIEIVVLIATIASVCVLIYASGCAK